jgi:plastocyanin
MRCVRLIPVLVVSFLAACGGSGDGGTTNPPPPATVSSISLSRSTALLKPTESATITATPKDASGNTVSGKTVTWTVLPSAGVASITSSGSSVTITGTANGTATVTASVDQKTADAHITVTTSIPTSADVAVGASGDTFTPSDADLAAGGTVTFSWNGVTHNVTWQTTPAAVSNIPDRSSGSVAVKLTQSGTYDYHCTIHPLASATANCPPSYALEPA